MKLMELAGYENQWSSNYSQEAGSFIRSNWSNIQDAWKANRIVPIRDGIPESYNQKNW
jgi:hypothetical protein